MEWIEQTAICPSHKASFGQVARITVTVSVADSIVALCAFAFRGVTCFMDTQLTFSIKTILKPVEKV